MNFDTLKKVKTLFWEIGDFYAKWNAGPEYIISDLLEHPAVKRRMSANQYQRERAAGVETARLDIILSPPNQKVSNVRLKKKLVGPYRLKGLDVQSCLYMDRIQPLRDEVFTAFTDELYAASNEAEERSRAVWCNDFDALLTSIEQEVARFNANGLDVKEPFEGGDWSGMRRALSDLAKDDIKPLILQYRQKIGPYLANQSKVESTPKPNQALLVDTSAPATSKQPPVSKYENFADLFVNSDLLSASIDALRQIDQPVINVAGNWIGGKGSKSVLVAWIERLETCNRIIRLSARRELVPLLNKQFPNLNMGADARIFGQQTTVYNRYKSEFAAIILP